MFARAVTLVAVLFGTSIKHAVALTCGDLETGLDSLYADNIIDLGSGVFQSQGYPSTIVPEGTEPPGYIQSVVDTEGSVCISFTDMNVGTGGNVLVFADSSGNEPVGSPLYTFGGTVIPKPFTLTAGPSFNLPYIQWNAPDGITGTGWKFTCSDGPCPCTTSGGPTGSAFDQAPDGKISSNGVAGSIEATAETCVAFSNVDLQGGTLKYDGITYRDGDDVGPFSIASGSGSIVYEPGPTGSVGSFTATCSQTTCAPGELSPCIQPGTYLDQSNQVFNTPNYPNNYGAGNAVVSIGGPACLTFDVQNYGTPGATLFLDGTALSPSVAPAPISVGTGELKALQWLASAAGGPGFEFTCNFGTCDSATTTTTASTTQAPGSTTTAAPTTQGTTTTASTTQAPGSTTTAAPTTQGTTTTATTTQTTVVPFPVASCTKKSCRTLVKQKKQRLITAAGCSKNDKACKKAVKATMPFNGNKKKACKAKTRQDVCQNIYWYTA